MAVVSVSSNGVWTTDEGRLRWTAVRVDRPGRTAVTWDEFGWSLNGVPLSEDVANGLRR